MVENTFFRMRKRSIPVWLLLTVLGLLPASVVWAQGGIAFSFGNGAVSGSLADLVSAQGIAVGLLAVFLGGLALNLTPCVYPMIPVTMAFFSSQGSGSPLKTARLALIYVLGMSLSYASLGFLAAQSGALLGSWLQKPAVLIAVAAVMVVLALGMFGAFEIRAPQAVLSRFGRASRGWTGAMVMGFVVGLVAAPCIGPFVIGLMLFVSESANPWTGFLLFFVLGLGMGLPYILLALVASSASRLPRAGGWLVWCKHVLAWILIGLALYFVNPLLSPMAERILLGVLLVVSGVYLGWLGRFEQLKPRFVLFKRVVGIALVAAACFVFWPRSMPASELPWQPYSDAALDSARGSGQPVMIDVFADWCIPCVELDRFTFTDARVGKALEPFLLLRMDATAALTKREEAFLEAHEVYGVPTVLFFDTSGVERKELRLLGFEKPDAFLDRLAEVLAPGG